MTDNNNLNYFALMRIFWDFCFENPDMIKPTHCALYPFIVEHCNRLGWKEKFGLPTTMAKDAVGIRSYNTYISTLNDLIDFGFIKLIEKSRNQYSSNIIALLNYNKALDKALDKAFIKHNTKQVESTIESTIESTSSIIRQYTNSQDTNKQNTNSQVFSEIKNFETPKIDNSISIIIQEEKKEKSCAKKEKFNFKKSLLEYGFKENLIDEWLLIRKTKKAVNTETAFKQFIKELETRSCDINKILQVIVENSWSGFKYNWVDNLTKNINHGKQQQTRSQSEVFIDTANSESAKHFKFS